MSDAATAANGFAEDPWPRDSEAGQAQAPRLTVPLDRLDEGGQVNVRTSATKAEIASLAASILHRGLLQPLVVAETGERYRVGAGNRRLRAFQLLRKQGKIPKDHLVWVTLAQEDELHEISLTENVMRVALHPVDEFEAFSGLVEEGLAVAAIADRFGLTEKAVRQRLALGRLAPEIRKAWRDGKIGQEQAQLFTMSESHDVQRAALKVATEHKGHFNEWQAASVLRGERTRAESGSFRFVGREAYLAAGGALTENLFGDDVLVEDPAILERLAHEKIAAICAALVTEQGWAWAEPRSSNHYSYGTLDLLPFASPLEKELLTGRDRNGSEAWKAKRGLHERAAALPAARAASGVLVDIGHNGEVELSTLRLRPEQADSTGDDDDDDDGEDERGTSAHSGPEGEEAEADDAEPEHGLSKALVEDLSEQLGQAVAQCLVQDPELALAATVAALTSSRWGNPFKVTLDGSAARKPPVRNAAFQARLAECLALDRHALLTELARAIGGALNITALTCSIDRKLPAGRDALIGAFDGPAFRGAVAEAFLPAEFFARAPGKVAKAAAHEAKGWAIAGKKDELAKTATAIAEETGWLPGPLRTVHYEALAGGTA
ncbi:ParB/RepB/Spo0J family partition protein [Bosea sp. TWI1241]|uniref:ParB/RepB/Spo0J family partition protein n=1 Tax=Bosea sp. TWI1241 TaxID=3148904 RepID=UPI00320985D9